MSYNIVCVYTIRCIILFVNTFLCIVVSITKRFAPATVQKRRTCAIISKDAAQKRAKTIHDRRICLMKYNRLLGHLLCIASVLIWGTTFISTKVLLQGFSPVEILFFRFLLGLAALTSACPKRMTGTTPRQEFFMALAGLSGVTLYYLFENISLTYTTASNVGIIVSAAPFFTVLLSHLLRQGDRLTLSFFVGFLFAIAGIGLITFTDISQLHLNPFGDFLAITAAMLWAVYSIVMKRVNGFGFSVLLVTRRIFLYGLFFMIPMLFILPFSPDFPKLADPLYLGNFLYLGIVACAVCFAIWNYALKILGTMATSIYIYAIPVVTIIASSLLLRESMTAAALFGSLLTIAGLILSEEKNFHWTRRNHHDSI